MSEVEEAPRVSTNVPLAAAPAKKIVVAADDADETNTADVLDDGGTEADGGDGELSEEEDTDYVEDTGEAGLRTGDSAEDGEESDAKPHIPMLLEGDYFPELPKDVLDELNALDAEDDTTTTGVPSGGSQSDTVVREVGGSSGSVLSDHQSHSSLSSSSVTIASATPSSSTASSTPALSSSSAMLAAAAAFRHTAEARTFDSVGGTSSVAPLDSRVTSPAPRKRLRWSDDCRGKRVGHVATVFTIPGFWVGADTASAAGPSFLRRGSSVSAGGGSAPRTFAAQQAIGPKWMTILNEDGTPFALAKQLRVSDAYHRWRSTDALEWSRRLYESGGGGSVDGSTAYAGTGLAANTNSTGDASRSQKMVPTTAAAGVVVPPYPIDRMLQQPGLESRQQETEDRRTSSTAASSAPRTFYAALFPPRGRLVLYPAETLRTTMVYVSGGLSQVPIPDDNGLVRAPLWHSDAHRNVLVVEPSPSKDEANGSDAGTSSDPSRSSVSQVLQATRRRRQTLFFLEDNETSSEDAPIRIVL